MPLFVFSLIFWRKTACMYKYSSKSVFQQTVHVHSMNYTSLNKHGARFLADLTHTIIKSSEPEIITQSQPKKYALILLDWNPLLPIIYATCSMFNSYAHNAAVPSWVKCTRVCIFLLLKIFIQYYMHIANCSCK